jgi:hypothetical protein
MPSYAPSQIDDANLAYHYTAHEEDARGVYYVLKTGAAGFPITFWASERCNFSINLRMF